MFKAVATDVDGTITDSKERIQPDAINKIRELEEIGIPVILISGHNMCSVETLSQYIGTTGPMVSENGCLVTRKRWEKPILIGSREKTEKAYKLLREKLGEKVILKPINRYRIVDLSLKRTFNVEEANKILEKHNVDAYIMDSGFAIHIIDKKVNKGVGVRKAAELLNISTKEIVGIGDGGNDYHFLREVGFSIALAHAPDEIKKIADYVTSKSYADGFVEAVDFILKKLLKK